MTKAWPLLLLSALGVTACGSSYKYHLIENNCDSGEHEFGSQAELCTALQNRTLNNNCSLGLRQQKFKDDGCPGTFTEFN